MQTKYLIHHQPKIVRLRVINADENHPILRQQPMQQLQARVHHAEPFVVAGKVFAFFADHLAEPFFKLRIVDVVVVNPAFVAGVVGRINVDAFDAAFVFGEQGFQRFQIVAVNDAIAAGIRRSVGCVEPLQMAQRFEGNFLVVIDDFVFSHPVECWHKFSGKKLFGIKSGLQANRRQLNGKPHDAEAENACNESTALHVFGIAVIASTFKRLSIDFHRNQPNYHYHNRRRTF